MTNEPQEPKGQLLTITLVGKTNVGKSSLLNLIAGQSVAIASPIAGTTTDVVEKKMELLPFGPILWLDTGGWDDTTPLGTARQDKMQQAIARADLILGVMRSGEPLDPRMIDLARQKKPLVLILTQTDLHPFTSEQLAQYAAALGATPILTRALDTPRDSFLANLKQALRQTLPSAVSAPSEPLAGILSPGATILHVIPIDAQAPKGRLILPQVNLLRNALDRDYISIVTTPNRIREAIALTRPDLAICDSQVLDTMIAALPPDILATTYSILMARLKGDLSTLARGAAAIARLQDGDKLLIAEACTHHATDDDIGRVKIPRRIAQATGKHLTVDVASGKDFPKDLTPYALILHCGGCMINRAFMLWRLEQAQAAHIPITNYGLAIAATQGHLDRVLQPFASELHYES